MLRLAEKFGLRSESKNVKTEYFSLAEERELISIFQAKCFRPETNINKFRKKKMEHAEFSITDLFKAFSDGQ